MAFIGGILLISIFAIVTLEEIKNGQPTDELNGCIIVLAIIIIVPIFLISLLIIF